MLDPFVSTRDPETDRPALCRVSQRHLELLETCPRKFQYTFLDRAIAPPRAESQTAIEVGSRFHLLVQQRELGLPIDILMAGNPQLQQWMDTLLTSVPELCVDPLPPRVFRQAEHERIFPLNGFALNVRYDLLVADEMQAQILDWKTYPKPQNRQKLEQSWQTRLYPYVLVETSQYVPEQVVMTYWYVRARHRSPEADVSGTESSEAEPQCHRFTYSSAAHQKTRQDLTRLLAQLQQWLGEYQEGRSLPTAKERMGTCPICQGSAIADDAQESDFFSNFNLDRIPELPL
jgi:PD-(D/E)XK nuclease superfamily